MKTPMKPLARPRAEEALRIVSQTAPALPPTQQEVADKTIAFNMRLKATTVAAIEAQAKALGGLTLKQVVCRALAQGGVEVAAADLEDGTPRRRVA